MAGKGKYILKIFGWFSLTILVLLIGFGVFVYFQAQSYVNENLSRIVTEKSNNLYKLSYNKIELEFTNYSISISDILLEPNEDISNRILEKLPGNSFFSFQSPEIKINEIDVVLLLKERTFFCKNITVEKPELELSGGEIIKNDPGRAFDKIFPELRPVFNKYVKEIVIDEINFVDANYGLYNTVGDSIQISNAEQISVGIKNFRTDSSMIFSNDQLFKTEDIFIRMKDFQNDLGDSLHMVRIDELEYSLKTSDINATGFYLAHRFKNPERSLYDVYVPRLYMKSQSVTRFSFSDSLNVQFLEFEKPQIKFFQKENPKQFKIEDIDKFDLYKLVENQFPNIEIDSFYLTGANLEIYRQPDFEKYQQRFESINITLNGFALDSSSSQNTEKLFHADNLEMTVAGYQLRLEDNQHDFKADSMFISTFSNSLGVKEITILPSGSEKINTRTSVNIECKALNIENVDLKTVFHTRALPTQRIEIAGPNVHLQYNTEITKPRQQKEAGLLFEQVSAYLKGVYSELVVIENGVLNIQNLNRGKVQGYFETGFNFNLTGFSLDSTSIKRTDKFFYATNFDLEFSDYQMKLVDNLHKINVDQISILSFDRKLQIENLHLQPIIADATESTMQQYNRSELYNIFVPKITMWGINLRNAFFNKKLSISNFQISNPKIYLENFGTLRTEQDNKEFGELYQLVFNYLSDFDIKKIEIPNGALTWVNHTKKGKTTSFDNEFSASLENFRLNENELLKKRLLFSDNFDISVKDQMFQLSDSVHILKAGEINLSTANSSVNIKNALLYPVITSEKFKELSTTFQVSIPQLQISEFDFLKAYYSKELNLARFDINSPKFQIYNQSGISKSLDLNKYKFPLPSFIKSLNLNELKVSNGEVISYETEGIDHRAQSNFKIDLLLPNVTIKNNELKQAQLSASNLIAKISEFKVPLGKTHDLKIGQIDFNRSLQTIDIAQLKINPFLQKKQGNQFTVFAPQLNFTGFDINAALKENDFSFDEIKVATPDIAIEINDSVKGDKFEIAQNLDLFPIVEPYVNKINVNRLYLNNVDLKFNWFEKQLINKKINLNFWEIQIGKNQITGNLLNSKEFEISTNNLKTTTKNNLYEFTVDSLIYNSAKHNILLKKLSVNPLLAKEEFPRQNGFQTDYLKAKTDFVELIDIDENLWLKEKILDGKKIIVGESEVDIYRNKRYPFNVKQRPPWPQDLIKEIIQPFIFDSVILVPSRIKYSELMDISDEPGFIEFNNLTLKAGKISNIEKIIAQNKNFEINTTAQLFNRAPLSAKFNFDLTDNNYAHTVSGSLGKMPLKELNVMIEKSVPISVETGELTRFDFDISFNKNLARGKLYFAYDEFKISVLELDYEGAKKSKLATFWANKMILNSKNPKGETLLPETITYERDVQRSIINYWWKAIFTGSKQTLGIKPDEQ